MNRSFGLHPGTLCRLLTLLIVYFKTGDTKKMKCDAFFLWLEKIVRETRLILGGIPGGALGYFSGGYVPPGTPNWHPVLEQISAKTDTPF